MGPKTPRSTVLSAKKEAVVVAFRQHTLLPLDNCLYALQPTNPHLPRSLLHRCLQPWHQPTAGREATSRQKESRHTAASISTSPKSRRQLHHCTLRGGAQVLERRLRAVTRRRYRQDRRGFPAGLDRGGSLQNRHRAHRQWRAVLRSALTPVRTPTARWRLHMFDCICREHDIEHRIGPVATRPGRADPSPQGGDRAALRNPRQLREHLGAFLDAYNFANRLKTAGSHRSTPSAKPGPASHAEFRREPIHLTSGSEHLL